MAFGGGVVPEDCETTVTAPLYKDKGGEVGMQVLKKF